MNPYNGTIFEDAPEKALMISCLHSVNLWKLATFVQIFAPARTSATKSSKVFLLATQPKISCSTTLDPAIQICQAQEAAKRQRASMSTGHDALAALQNPQEPLQRNLLSPGQPLGCSGCSGKPHPGGRSRCPAFNVTCNACGKTGHFAKVCRSKLPAPQRETNSTSPDANALSLLSTISHVTSLALPAPSLK